MLVGSPRSIWVNAAPLIHFHSSLSLLSSSALSLISTIDLPAVRQPVAGASSLTQPPIGSQESAVQESSSSQSSGSAPMQVPPWQVSVIVHVSLSLQPVPSGSLASAGHAALRPVQASATSH